MVMHQGTLYIGAGDYDANTGNTPIYAWSPATKTWTHTGTVLDEAVARFVSVGEALYVPGTDPTTNTWAYGNYYRQTENGWQVQDNLPDSVHHFDLVRYQNALFFGIGTANAQTSPVKLSEDEGDTYRDVDFYKEGKPVVGRQEDAYYRVYDFYLLEDTLYCFLVVHKQDGTRETGFYAYMGDRFEFVCNPGDVGLKRFGLWQVYMGAKCVVNQQCYFTTGHLYQTDDFQSFEEIQFPDARYVTDFVPEGDYLYVLTVEDAEENGYMNTLWRFHAKTGAQTKIVSFFTKEGFPLSLAKDKSTFYVGLAHGAQAGTVLRIEPKALIYRMLGLLPPDNAAPIVPEDWSSLP